MNITLRRVSGPPCVLPGTLNRPFGTLSLLHSTPGTAFRAILNRHLVTGDHTAIYAELYATVESVLKSTGDNLAIGSEIKFLSPGGTLILPDNRVISSPRNRYKSRFQPGHKYVFFANYYNDTESYGVPEVWEIRDGRVTRVIPEGILADGGSRSRLIGAHGEDFLSMLKAELNACDQ